MVLDNIRHGHPTGHMIGLDAVCSGMQIMSALTGCMEGLRVTGMIDPEAKADAYTAVLKHMQTLIDNLPDSQRDILKQCVMHTLYGSQKTPKQMYGEDSPELHAFYQTLETLAPGACMLLGQLRNAWQPFCSDHRWTLPDGHTAVVP